MSSEAVVLDFVRPLRPGRDRVGEDGLINPGGDRLSRARGERINMGVRIWAAMPPAQEPHGPVFLPYCGWPTPCPRLAGVSDPSTTTAPASRSLCPGRYIATFGPALE